jgi:hypothetical protein
LKEDIYNTNHRNPEKDLLSKQNIRQTLRLTLANAFTESEADRFITATIQHIFIQCPSLFRTLLPRSELNTAEEDEEDERYVCADAQHRQVSVIGCIPTKYCREELFLPARASLMDSAFRTALRDAYGADYGIPNIAQFDSSTFQYGKKLSFVDETQRRKTLRIGDFVHVNRSRGDAQHIIRIDHIFIHNWDDQRRVFIRATEVDTTRAPSFDPVLDCQVLRLHPEKTATIGLPAICTEQLYIIPVVKDPFHPSTNDRVAKLQLGGSDSVDLLWIEQSVQWL